jgi:hypothetical protein
MGRAKQAMGKKRRAGPRAGEGASPRGEKKGAGWAGLEAKVAFLFSSPFLFKPTQIYLNSNQIWIQIPMHSLK